MGWRWCRNHDVCIKYPSEQHAQSSIPKCQWISYKGNREKAKADSDSGLRVNALVPRGGFLCHPRAPLRHGGGSPVRRSVLVEVRVRPRWPIHEEGRGGVALAWKTCKWTLQAMQFLSPRALKASLSSGPLEITLMVVHFHHKHSRRQAQWKEIAKELHGPNLILCADHNSLIVKHRDAPLGV